MTPETEQWLLDGNCGKCRRKKYCKKTCTRHNRREHAEMMQLIGEASGLPLGNYIMQMRKLEDRR